MTVLGGANAALNRDFCPIPPPMGPSSLGGERPDVITWRTMNELADPTLDLPLVQHHLDVLARWRASPPLSAWEEERYRQLCGLERLLLQSSPC